MTRRGRGRPLLFDTALREQYLAAVTSGMRLGDAARHCGININLARTHARTDPAFAEALDHARTLGKKTREANLPHNESRYTNHACRCGTCRHCATTARRGRRHTTTEPDTTPDAEVIDLPPPAAQLPARLLPFAS
ncbi:hypothetical protein [Streptomyces xanthochromogenes]